MVNQFHKGYLRWNYEIFTCPIFPAVSPRPDFAELFKLLTFIIFPKHSIWFPFLHSSIIVPYRNYLADLGVVWSVSGPEAPGCPDSVCPQGQDTGDVFLQGSAERG